MIWSTSTALLLALAAVSSGHRTKRQSGTVDPSTSKYCDYYNTALDKTYTCSYFESYWGISHSDFVAWNPSIKSDCSGIKVGNSYCVEVSLPTTTTTKAPATSSPAPSPTASGQTKDCVAYHKAVSGDTCDKIAASYGTFATAQFVQWNPSVKSDCSGLYLDIYYCVGVPGTPTSKTTTSVKPINGVSTPTPTHTGMVDHCSAFYLVKSGDGCQGIADKYGITLAQFADWQNVGGLNCRGLQADTYACVNIIGRTASTTKPAATTTTKASNGVSTPTPTQPGMVDNCNAFYLVKTGDGCQAIADKYAITLTQFTSWQNVGGSQCTGLQANVYVCVNIIGRTPSSTKAPVTTTTKASNGVTTPTPTQPECTQGGSQCAGLQADVYVCVNIIGRTPSTTKAATTTKASNGITTPTPTQPGMVGNCDQFYYVKSGDGCQAIVDKYGITLNQFTSWQNVGGSGCSGLQANVYVCVSIIGQTATPKTTTPAATTCPTAHPTPTQPGAVCRCKSYHKVADGDTCATIEKKYGITDAQFKSWNPDTGSNCGTLWRDYYVCVSA